MRIIFLGTPEFAVPSLEKLIAWPKVEVVGLVCQPDRPSGRGQKLSLPATKLVAQARGVPVMQPERLSRSPETLSAMEALKPDMLVMVAFGQILKRPVLEMAPYGVLNVHGSLLPRYRGAAPINWALINGETETGITTMQTDIGVDTGHMLLKQAVPIDIETDAEQLSEILARTGADLLIRTIDQIMAGTIQPQPQDDSQASMAPMLKKEMGAVDWSRSDTEIHNLVRGLFPWPGTYTQFSDSMLKIIRTRPGGSANSGMEPGRILIDGDRILVTCGKAGETALELLEVQPANRARMKARDWANGVRLSNGALLGSRALT